MTKANPWLDELGQKKITEGKGNVEIKTQITDKGNLSIQTITKLAGGWTETNMILIPKSKISEFIKSLKPMTNKSPDKTKTNQWEEELKTACKGYIIDACPNLYGALKHFIRQLLSHQRQEILDQVEKYVSEWLRPDELVIFNQKLSTLQEKEKE